MNAAGRQNLAQGGEYKAMHAGQYGGGAVLEGAPVGTTGMLDSSLRAAAHMGPLDKSMAAIQGMSDQAGGARKGSNRKASRNGRKASRKGRKGSKRKASRKGRKASRKGRKASRKGRKASRKMRGGAALNPADADAPGTLLPSELASKALTQMNPEWKLAENPASFAPAPAPAPKA
jgi:hypothetical protein